MIGGSLLRKIRVLLIYLLGLGIPFVLGNYISYLKIRPYDYRDAWYHAIFKPGFWYQRVVAIGPRKPRRHYVRMVTIREGKEPDEVLAHNVCMQRLFMAKLLQRLAKADPAVIVIDKWYSPTACLPDDKGTKELRDVIIRISQKLPIVLGVYSCGEKQLKERDPGRLRALVEKGFKSKEQILAPALLSGESMSSGEVVRGLVRLDYDSRKIPLRWPTYAGIDDVGRKRPQELPTLALAAAMKYDPHLSERSAFKDLVRKGRFPYTGFLTEKELTPYSAIDLMCSEQDQRQLNWRACQPDEGNKDYLHDLRSRIVIIGEYAPLMDFHETVIGKVPGVMLQTNYIESLLDDRYLKPASSWLELVLSLAWFAVIELIFQRASPPLERALLYALFSTGIVVFVCYYWVILALGYYLELLPPGVLAVVFRVVSKYIGLRLPKLTTQRG